jgi:heme exporter protein D
MTHTLYVTAAYLISGIAILGLAGWLLRDQAAQKRALAELEAAGVRRGPARPGVKVP